MMMDESTLHSSKIVKAMMCYICQKEFNVKKLDQHVSQCKLNWDSIQERRRPEYRLPRPKEPSAFRETLIQANNIRRTRAQRNSIVLNTSQGSGLVAFDSKIMNDAAKFTGAEVPITPFQMEAPKVVEQTPNFGEDKKKSVKRCIKC